MIMKMKESQDGVSLPSQTQATGARPSSTLLLSVLLNFSWCFSCSCIHFVCRDRSRSATESVLSILGINPAGLPQFPSLLAASRKYPAVLWWISEGVQEFN